MDEISGAHAVVVAKRQAGRAFSMWPRHGAPTADDVWHRSLGVAVVASVAVRVHIGAFGRAACPAPLHNDAGGAGGEAQTGRRAGRHTDIHHVETTVSNVASPPHTHATHSSTPVATTRGWVELRCLTVGGHEFVRNAHSHLPRKKHRLLRTNQFAGGEAIQSE